MLLYVLQCLGELRVVGEAFVVLSVIMIREQEEEIWNYYNSAGRALYCI